MNKATILEQQDFSGSDLSGYSLGAMDLRGKNFRGADLSHAHLGMCDLRGADFRNANLHHANLGAADLRGADMRYCDLREANLVGAVLEGADMREVIGFETETSLASMVKPVVLEETDDYLSAKNEGFFPLSHWGKKYSLNRNNKTLYKSLSSWRNLKSHLGESIFSDRTTYSEVRLVQQYKHYSQWAYMISKKGFERISQKLGLSIREKHR